MILPIVFPGVAATACPHLVSFLLDPAATRGHHPWHTKLQSLALFAAFLLGVSSAVCTRQPVRSWLLHLQSSSVLAPAQLPVPTPVLHLSDPARRGAVADARLGLA